MAPPNVHWSPEFDEGAALRSLFRRVLEAAGAGAGVVISPQEAQHLKAVYYLHLSGDDPSALFGAKGWEINERVAVADRAMRLYWETVRPRSVHAAATDIEVALIRYVSSGAYRRAINDGKSGSDIWLDLLVAGKGRPLTDRTYEAWISRALEPSKSEASQFRINSGDEGGDTT